MQVDKLRASPWAFSVGPQIGPQKSRTDGGIEPGSLLGESIFISYQKTF